MHIRVSIKQHDIIIWC